MVSKNTRNYNFAISNHVLNVIFRAFLFQVLLILEYVKDAHVLFG